MTHTVTKLIHKALYQQFLVLKVLFTLLFFCASFGQTTKEDKNVILAELLRHKAAMPNNDYTKNKIGDSIIVAKKVLKFSNSIDEIKEKAIVGKYITEEEAKEIFSKDFQNPDQFKIWTYEELPDIEIILFDNKKYTSAVTIKNDKTVGLGTFNILSVSEPRIRVDKKYALIETSHRHYGVVIHIYKNTDKGWVHYKDVQIMLI